MSTAGDDDLIMSMTHDRTAWLKGTENSCRTPHARPPRPYRLVLLGAPGVGKGTQAELLHERLGACPLSTGDIFRAAKSAGDCGTSEAMRLALDAMRKGELVSDDTVLAIVAERAHCLRCGGGFLLDGFPRTIAQAEALVKLLEANGVQLDAVVSYELPIEEIVSRLGGRRTCGKCKAVFHVTSRPPKTEGVCDHCQSALVQREDDRPESVRVRMEVYAASTRPLTDYFGARGLLVTVPADGSPTDILDRTLAALEAQVGAGER
jgi:adenylate kinase